MLNWVSGPGICEDTGWLVRDQEAVDCFWEHMVANTYWARDHPARGENPISIYGDESRYNEAGDKVLALCLSPVLQRDAPGLIAEIFPNQNPKTTEIKHLHTHALRGHDVLKRYPLMFLRSWISLGHQSLFPVLQIMTWSFNCLFCGLHPHRSISGAPYKGIRPGGSRIAGLPSKKSSR